MVLTDVGCFEMQNAASTNHIGRFGGLDVISGIIGDRFIDPKK